MQYADRVLGIISEAQQKLSPAELIEAINEIKLVLHAHSPMRHEPVDCVLWVPAGTVQGNEYNPNVVAPPEMELLKVSILEDGYTQPIVTFSTAAGREVVDGFHRSRVGKECAEVAARVQGYLPVVTINAEREDKGDRIASTIRHNRARGKHRVDAMSDIVVELRRRNWSEAKIARELGMDPDEILRLTQITGLAELFANQDFSMSWEVGTGDTAEIDLEDEGAPRAVAEGRIYHTFDQWECYPAGFYENQPREKLADPEASYAEFLRDDLAFRAGLERVLAEWPRSCEHYLSNQNMNRIAWLGQAAACIALGIPSCFRGGFHRLPESEQARADATALEYLNHWRASRGEDALTMEDAAPKTKADLY